MFDFCNTRGHLKQLCFQLFVERHGQNTSEENRKAIFVSCSIQRFLLYKILLLRLIRNKSFDKKIVEIHLTWNNFNYVYIPALTMSIQHDVYSAHVHSKLYTGIL